MMSLLLSMWMSPAALGQEQGACERVSLGQVVSDPGPGILFLGERHGTTRDLNRAHKIVRKLAKHGEVTLAIEAVPAASQDVLDRLALGKVPFDALPEALQWDQRWGFSFRSYEKLLKLYRRDVRLIGVGQPFELRPEDTTVALPPGYALVLTDAMGDSPVPMELEPRLVQTMAWHDHRMAASALAGWSGQGWLVVLVDRTWLEGGLGAQWQATRLTDASVDAVLLADAGSRCYRGDRLLK